MDVIYPPTLNWNWMRQRPQQLMLQFARDGHRVFFCNQYHQPRQMEEAAPNLYVVHDHRRFEQDVVPDLAAPVVWCSWPKLHDTLDQYRPGMVVFDCIDRFPDWNPFVDAMVGRADVVVASSASLFDEMLPRHPRVHLVRNGCDFSHFENAGHATPEPSDLAPYRRPRAGFAGAWAPWVDGALLDEVARMLPDWSFILMGPALGGTATLAPNAHLLGWKSYEQLPHYLHNCDVLVLPFLHNETTQCADPIKLWEYLATGNPVVATPIPMAVAMAPEVGVAGTPAEFAARLQETRELELPCLRQERVALSRANSWEARYREIVRAIPELLG